MTPKAFTAGWLMAAGVLSSWAVSFASDEQAPRPPARAAERQMAALPPLSVDIDAEISRLSARSFETTDRASAGARDPFSFAAPSLPRSPRRASSTPVVAAPAVVVEAPPAERAPEPSLSGLAEVTPGVMTAVIAFRDELHFLKKGDVLASRYRVDAIGADAVELFDLVSNKIVRLSLLRTMIVQSAVYPHLMR